MILFHCNKMIALNRPDIQDLLKQGHYLLLREKAVLCVTTRENQLNSPFSQQILILQTDAIGLGVDSLIPPQFIQISDDDFVNWVIKADLSVAWC